MKITANKRNGILIAIASSLTLIGVVASFVSAKGFLRNLKADIYLAKLNHDNAPTLTAGEGTMVDEHNITWEYHNASSYANGHVTISNEGYVGVSSTSIYGYTGIDGLTANFTKGTNSELWLLLSYDGDDWFESEMLTSGEETHAADNWRYVRFYCYDPDSNSININSVNFNYVCTGGISGTDDVDYATLSNIRSSKNLVATEETTIISPASNLKNKSTTAVRLTIVDSPSDGSRNVVFNIPETTLDKIKHYSIAFDYYYKEKRDPNKAPGFPTTKMANAKSESGTGRTKGSPVWSYTELADGWWHIECSVMGMVQLGDNRPTTVIAGITIVDGSIFTYDTEAGPKKGFIVIDNLRLIVSSPKGAVTNNWTSVKINPIVDPTATPKVDDRYYIRENYCGYLHSASYEIQKISGDEGVTVAQLYWSTEKTGYNLTYIEGLNPGEIKVKFTYVLGYKHTVVEFTTAKLTVENYPESSD